MAAKEVAVGRRDSVKLPSSANMPSATRRPSVPLTNKRHEEFARALARGAKQSDAYRQAGFASRSSRAVANNAVLLAKKDSVRQRVKWLLSHADQLGATDQPKASNDDLETLEQALKFVMDNAAQLDAIAERQGADLRVRNKLLKIQSKALTEHFHRVAEMRSADAVTSQQNRKDSPKVHLDPNYMATELTRLQPMPRCNCRE